MRGLSTVEGNQTPTTPVGGRTEFAQPVFQKIVRQALGGVRGLRLEPLDSGNPLAQFLRRPRGRVLASQEEDRLHLVVPLQAEHGRRIPELAEEALRAITAEVQRLIGCQQVTVKLHLIGLFSAEREG